MKMHVAAAILTFISFAPAASMPAVAGARYQQNRGEVSACSRYSNGCYTAQAVASRHGRQIELRNGTRIDCEGDCKNTLREATVDFWDTMRENGG
jgi:hypothetical protein